MNNPSEPMAWRQHPDVSNPCYQLDRPVFAHVARWRHPGSRYDLWHVRLVDRDFFLPKSFDDAAALQAVEHVLQVVLTKMCRRLGENAKGPSLPIELGIKIDGILHDGS